jgi:hypothetical protein
VSTPAGLDFPRARPIASGVDLRIVARDRDLVCLSDKTVDKVIGYAVRFDDGSWANLRSRRYTGSAPGRVFFLRAPAPSNGAAPPTARARTHDLGRVVELTLDGVGGDVVVARGASSGSLEVSGDAGFVDGTTVDVRSGHVRAAWSADEVPGIVRCAVPERCKLVIAGAGDAHFWIAVAAPALRATLADDASLFCERSSDLDVELNGRGGAFVGLARGRARVRASGSGSAVVADGHLEELDAMVLSSGSVVVHAAVDRALLSTSGSGALSVPAIAQLSERHGRGAGPLLAGRPAPPAGERW